MSKKPFDYSKWDNIEISDDDEDCHPNIDRESWFRMKHRSRVEREENENKDKKRIHNEMEKANQRMKILRHDIEKLKQQRKQQEKDDDDDDDDDDDLDLDDCEGLEAELNELVRQNMHRQMKLDEYEKNKKWNIDNMFTVKDEKTIVNPSAGKTAYDSTSGFVKPKDDDELQKNETTTAVDKKSKTTAPESNKKKVDESTIKKKTNSSLSSSPSSSGVVGPSPPKTTASKGSSSSSSSSSGNHEQNPQQQQQDKSNGNNNNLGAMETYHEFTEKYAEIVEQFMALHSMDESREFLLKYGDVLLQENSSNYLLLACLEDEMNGLHTKMKLVARQSQIISNIAEMAKTIQQHPGNVIQPFFNKMQMRIHFEEFMTGVDAFATKIQKRAITKKKEMDEQRRFEEELEQQQQQQQQGDDGDESTMAKDLHDVPREERLGPGGLDPLEVIETLPEEMVKAFESRDIEQLKAALMKLPAEDAERYMKDCIDSGLWVANA